MWCCAWHTQSLITVSPGHVPLPTVHSARMRVTAFCFLFMATSYLSSASAALTLPLGNNPGFSPSDSTVHAWCPYSAGMGHIDEPYCHVLYSKVSLFLSPTGLLKSTGLLKIRPCELYTVISQTSGLFTK